MGEIAERVTSVCDNIDLPRVEYEDINSGEGTLNKPINKLKHYKAGISFTYGDILYGKLRPYLHNWLLSQFTGIAVGDFWVLRPKMIDSRYLYQMIQSATFDKVANVSAGSKMPRADWNLMSNSSFFLPLDIAEQRLIGDFFCNLESLITLHQRERL